MRTSLRAKLGIALLVVALVPTAAASALVFHRQRSAIIDDRLDRLSAIATVQQKRVEAWVGSSEDALALIASRTRFGILLRDLQEPDLSPVDRAFKVNAMTGILHDAADASRNVSDVRALDRSGRVVASTVAGEIGVDLSGEPYVLAARPGRPSLSHVGRVDGAIVGVHARVVERDGQELGWVVVEQWWAPLLDVLIDRSGLGRTGEAVLIRRDPVGGELVSLGPLRGRTDATLRPLPGTATAARPAEDAVSGPSRNAEEATDYRGEAVVAATRPIGGADWGLVVKQDREEILEPITRLRNTLLLIAGAMTVLAIVAAWLVAHRLTRNIADLTATARRVARGDRSARASVRTRDELSELAVAFNRMTDDLVGHEEELETRKTQLESFLYVSSHDLKTPLRSVSSFSQLLRLDYDASLDDRAKHYVERIEEGAMRTIDVIDDLLAYVRVDHNQHETERVDLTEAAMSARDLLGSTIAETGAKVTIGDLGVIDGNRALLVQLFQNLIGNALKYARPAASPVVAVTPEGLPGRNGSDLAFVVADNGVGVPEEFRSRVFAPFERLHGSDAVAGTGLGLAVCERIVALHEGTIEFIDSPLGGAAVRVDLTARSSPPAVRSAERSAEPTRLVTFGR